MKALAMLFTVLMLGHTIVSAQVLSSNLDSTMAGTMKRRHKVYVEAGGAGHYWSFGYGYTFLQKEKHEMYASIGTNFVWISNDTQVSAFPIGIFYRYGKLFKVETGVSVSPMLNWARFYQKSYYDSTAGYLVEIPNHILGITPSVGMVYCSKNDKIELGIRYTPLFIVVNSQDMLPIWFGGFFVYKIK